MTCRHVEHLRDAYQDGELSSHLATEVHAHLLACRECQQHFEMMRITGEVIGRDDAKPQLDTGFASRVVASMAQTRPMTPKVIVGAENEKRWPFRRLFITGSVPAAAAALFLALLIWPTDRPHTGPHGLVLGEKREATDLVKDAVDETMKAFKETGKAIDSVSTMTRMLGDQARETVGTETGETPREVSLLDVFLEPFNEVLVPAEAQKNKDDSGVVRF
jgi:hypothetical protein